MGYFLLTARFCPLGSLDAVARFWLMVFFSFLARFGQMGFFMFLARLLLVEVEMAEETIISFMMILGGLLMNNDQPTHSWAILLPPTKETTVLIQANWKWMSQTWDALQASGLWPLVLPPINPDLPKPTNPSPTH